MSIGRWMGKSRLLYPASLKTCISVPGRCSFVPSGQGQQSSKPSPLLPHRSFPSIQIEHIFGTLEGLNPCCRTCRFVLHRIADGTASQTALHPLVGRLDQQSSFDRQILSSRNICQIFFLRVRFERRQEGQGR